MHNQKKTLPSKIKTNLLEFDVKGVNNEKINLAGLYDSVFIAKKMGRREGHQSVNGLCTLNKPYKMQVYT